MVLSEEEKAKIEEEEEYRAKVRKNITISPKTSEKRVPWWKPKGKGAWLFIIVMVFIFAISVLGSSSDDSTPSTKQEESSLLPQSEEEKQRIIEEQKAKAELHEKLVDDLTKTFCESRSEPWMLPNRIS